MHKDRIGLGIGIPLILVERPALAAILAERFQTRPAGEWERDLAEVAGCVRADEGPMANFVMVNPVNRELGFATPVEHPFFGEYLRHGPAVNFSLTPGALATAPTIGQHSLAILAELGLDADTIDDLRRRRLVRADGDA